MKKFIVKPWSRILQTVEDPSADESRILEIAEDPRGFFHWVDEGSSQLERNLKDHFTGANGFFLMSLKDPRESIYWRRDFRLWRIF
jgi:hypothetical protein